MVQYYRDIWVRRSEILAPLTNLVGECGHTKVTRANKTKKKPWHWDDIHQQAFDTFKISIVRRDYSKQQALALLFSRKLSQAQQKYSADRTGTTGHSRNTKRVQRHALGTTDYGLH
eukprot:CCRYP_019049-RA/>CCRYP_019049-RA protein AED:0.47 eAED:0.60 QI:0/0/0/1/0/0/2/0/115